MVMTSKQSLFFAPTSKRLARDITITSPFAFRKSIQIIKKGGVTLQEKRALVLAQNRASAQLMRKNLSIKERVQFTTIQNMRLPKVTR
ncbi:hypothetical protein LCGC14_1584190 [marine sediment metagenome]|uniref:Uncharacterized protein n=1 Tax=marine sediment metagenome TaxID=412755 RepID=A0A0F9IG78_9ZZZZ